MTHDILGIIKQYSYTSLQTEVFILRINFRYYAIETARQRKNVIAVSSGAPLLVGNASNLMTAQNGGSKMPWLTYLRSPALW